MADEDPCASCVSMTEWIQNEDEGEECRSCLLPPVIQWYRDELQEKGLDNLASQIKAAVESGDPLLMAKKFDEVKERVPGNVKERLKEFDCYAQIHKGNGDGE